MKNCPVCDIPLERHTHTMRNICQIDQARKDNGSRF